MAVTEIEFQEYHNKHPEIYHFIKDTFSKQLENGVKWLSTRNTFALIRLNRGFQKDSDFDYKVNNNYSPFYTKLYLSEFPQHAQYFRTRTEKSKNRSKKSSVSHSKPVFVKSFRRNKPGTKLKVLKNQPSLFNV